MREPVKDEGAVASEEATRNARQPSRLQPTRTKHIGRTLKGRYQLELLLGIGAMGEVYRALDLELGQRCAVKLVLPGAMLGLQAHRRFTTEAAVISRLFHPNIVAVRDVGEDEDGTRFLVMELLVGRSLHQHLEERGRLPLSEALAIAAAVGSALQYAHDLGFVHRDVTPNNIFLCSEGDSMQRVKVLDFGLARIMGTGGMGGMGDGGGTPIEQLTRGIVVGTPSYLAPEATSLASHLLDARADQWSLGVLLYQMLAGRLPFVHPNPFTLCHLICTAEPVPLAERAPGLPEHVYQAVATALSKQREARFERVSDLIRSLSNLPALAAAGPLPERRDASSLAPSSPRGAAVQHAPAHGAVSPGATRRLQLLETDGDGAAAPPGRESSPWLDSGPGLPLGAGARVEEVQPTVRYSAEQLRKLGLTQSHEPSAEPVSPAVLPERPQPEPAKRSGSTPRVLPHEPAKPPPLPVQVSAPGVPRPAAEPSPSLKMPPPLLLGDSEGPAPPQAPPRADPGPLRQIGQSLSLAMGLALALLLGLLLARYVSPAPLRSVRHARLALLQCATDVLRVGTAPAFLPPHEGQTHAIPYAG